METRSGLGARAEAAAAEYLSALDFKIIGRNVRMGALEIDIVARKAELIVVVEVRTRGRGSFTSALASITKTKRQRIVRAATRYWKENFENDPTADRLRFDVIAVYFEAGSTRVEHITAAFTAD